MFGAKDVFEPIYCIFLTGLWHGASWNFIVWGIWYALFLIGERFMEKRFSNIRIPCIIQHIYVCLVILMGWVFFRSETCSAAFSYIRAMFSFRFDHAPAIYVSIESMTMLIIGIVFATVTCKLRFRRRDNVFALICFSLSILYMVGNGFSPFLYFRF